MIYDSIDKIPAKLFFKIEATGMINLLSDENIKESALVEIWELLQEQNAEINPDKVDEKILNISKQVESLSKKQKATEIAIIGLGIKRDQDLIDLLKNYGYKLHLNKFNHHLSIIEKQNENLNIKINNLINKLPKKDDDKEKSSFDDVWASICIMLSIGYVNSNEILLPQYYSYVKSLRMKIKNIENED